MIQTWEIPERRQAVNLVATNLAQELIVEPDGDTIQRAQNLFVMTSSHAEHKPDFLASAIRAASTDGKLATHCVNTAVYSLALGSYLKIGDASVLGDFAVAGLPRRRWKVLRAAGNLEQARTGSTTTNGNSSIVIRFRRLNLWAGTFPKIRL